jgi:hypothetical protein
VKRWLLGTPVNDQRCLEGTVRLRGTVVRYGSCSALRYRSQRGTGSRPQSDPGARTMLFLGTDDPCCASFHSSAGTPFNGGRVAPTKQPPRRRCSVLARALGCGHGRSLFGHGRPPRCLFLPGWVVPVATGVGVAPTNQGARKAFLGHGEHGLRLGSFSAPLPARESQRHRPSGVVRDRERHRDDGRDARGLNRPRKSPR